MDKLLTIDQLLALGRVGSDAPPAPLPAPRPYSYERACDLLEDTLHMHATRSRELAAALRRAEVAERERDALLGLVSQLDPEQREPDGRRRADLPLVEQLARAGAALLTQATLMHERADTGITVGIEVDGRKLEIVAQWLDAPIRTNWVEFAREIKAMARGPVSEGPEP